MQFTTQQAAIIKAHILATPALADKASGPGTDYAFLADSLNADFEPAFYVYPQTVQMSEIMLNGFDWTRVDNLSVGKARIWEWMTDARGDKSIDPSKENVRAGINAVWVGTAADLAVRAAVYLHCQRPATLAEKLLVLSGAGVACDASGAGPATLGWTGAVQIGEMGEILA